MQSGTQAPMLGRWSDLLLAVSVEFAFVFWAASALIAWDHASLSQAPALAALFFGRHGHRSCHVGADRSLDFAPRGSSFWCAQASRLRGFACSGPRATLAALGGAGLAGGPWRRTSLSDNREPSDAAWPHAPDRAAARAALGSGIAIGGAPFLLAQLSGCDWAARGFLIVPTLPLCARRSRREGRSGAQSYLTIPSGDRKTQNREMRIAVLCDIHGNLPALQAVLAEVDQSGVDTVVFGGDVAAGPMPVETIGSAGRLRPPSPGSM